jgi:Uma2 family endonuclease
MATATIKKRETKFATVADLLERLGNVPPERVRFDPPPGTATEKDVLAAWSRRERRLCELVHGTLGEKAMGTRESNVAPWIIVYLGIYLEKHDLGQPLSSDGMVRLKVGLVRIPDVGFISWERLPEGEIPPEPIASRVPELAVEVLSESNTPEEIKRKIGEYFEAGVKLVWIIQPKTQTADEYTSPTERRHVGRTQSLSGHDVLPGFTLSLKKLFDRTKRRGMQR